MTRLPLLTVLLFFSCSAVAATFSGAVVDSEGAVIAGAHVVIHWDPSGSNYLKDNPGIKQDMILTTDANGSFSLDLPPGFYDVFVSSISFSPYCEKVRIKGDTSQRFKAKLKLSPVTSRELD